MKEHILSGKNCLITGATGGIGEKLAFALQKEGCNLFLTSTCNKKLNQLKQQLEHQSKQKKSKIYYDSADLSSKKDIERLILSIKNVMPHIDVLINNAGIFIVKPLEDLDVEDLEKTLNINVRAAFILSKELSKNMKKNKWGRIVNIGSSSAYGASKETIAYAASKHALLGMTKALHEELSEYHIRAYFISPAGTKTDMGKKIKNQNFDTFVSPEEIATYITFIMKFDTTMIPNEVRLNRMVMQ